MRRSSVLCLLCCLAFFARGQETSQVGAVNGNARFATDAYPGFDADGETLAPERKEPKWFAFINGPKKDTASEQYAYCQELEADQRWSKAVKHYDALVREWPTAPEAPLAQLRLAEILFTKIGELDEAFAEYRYLLDFYSFRCDYDAAATKLYEIARAMEEEGRTVLFFRFRNTTEVRRAYEACVLRAPGATWAPQALLAVGALREDEGEDARAVAVYENLRNLHYETEAARLGTLREAAARMRILERHGYNRARCQDTVDFLKLALTIVPAANRAEIEAQLAVANGKLEEEAFAAAKFYDSRMRTKRSAIAAYEHFLAEFPNGVHADEVRARIDELTN